MDQILFGDIFINIELYLSPKDLYELSCERFNNIISDKCIKNKVIKEINMRLRHNLEDNYDEFIKIMLKMNASIVGSFITQCLLDETWDGS
uniref:Uncharacterized protein n=1 Tax=viral metagenome TaxID=1070528 RepID=A0A6C0C8B8_9ZZZZ